MYPKMCIGHSPMHIHFWGFIPQKCYVKKNLIKYDMLKKPKFITKMKHTFIL
jgi:hypothetical protein